MATVNELMKALVDRTTKADDLSRLKHELGDILGNQTENEHHERDSFRLCQAAMFALAGMSPGFVDGERDAVRLILAQTLLARLYWIALNGTVDDDPEAFDGIEFDLKTDPNMAIAAGM